MQTLPAFVSPKALASRELAHSQQWHLRKITQPAKLAKQGRQCYPMKPALSGAHLATSCNFLRQEDERAKTFHSYFSWQVQAPQEEVNLLPKEALFFQHCCRVRCLFVIACSLGASLCAMLLPSPDRSITLAPGMACLNS